MGALRGGEEVHVEMTVLDAEPTAFWFGAWNNLHFLVWLRAATVDAVARLDRMSPARVAAHPEGISTVHIITESAQLPDAEVRKVMNEFNARWGHTVGCAAVVIEQRGFAGVAMRSAVAGMSLLAPKRYRIKVSDSVDGVAPWLAEQHARTTQRQFGHEEVLAALRTARASAR